MAQLDVLGLCGSLRHASLNRQALQLAGDVMPAGMRLEIGDWREVPIFDQDLMDTGWPTAVQALRERIRRCDALVIATPEYNFSLPGAFKNVIDWISRGDDQPFAGKPVAIFSASQGPLGGARVQYELRRTLLFVNAMVLAKPEVFIGGAAAKFDGAGACTDEATRKIVTTQMAALHKWIRGVQAMHAAG